MLANQRNRIDRNMLAANVVTVRFRNRSERDLANLRAATHNDDSLAVDLLKRLHRHGRTDDRQPRYILDQRFERAGEIQLEINPRVDRLIFHDRNRTDIAVVLGNDTGELVENSGAADSCDEQTNFAAGRLAQTVTSYFLRRPSQWP